VRGGVKRRGKQLSVAPAATRGNAYWQRRALGLPPPPTPPRVVSRTRLRHEGEGSARKPHSLAESSLVMGAKQRRSGGALRGAPCVPAARCRRGCRPGPCP